MFFSKASNGWKDDKDCYNSTDDIIQARSNLFKGTLVRRVAAHLLFQTPITMQNIENMIEKDVFVPVDIILARPYMDV